LLLARNTSWWGADRGLGPGVDQIEPRAVPDPEDRLALLLDGTVRVAELDPGQLGAVHADPLLAVQHQGEGRALGIERSVRGIPAGEPAPSLNAVWLTGIDVG
jgi:ABC-type transport system substrate-binding protein